MSAVDTNDLDELVARIFNMAFDFATAATEFARQENAQLRAEVERLRAELSKPRCTFMTCWGDDIGRPQSDGPRAVLQALVDAVGSDSGRDMAPLWDAARRALAGEPLTCQNCDSPNAVTLTVCQGCAFLIEGES